MSRNIHVTTQCKSFFLKKHFSTLLYFSAAKREKSIKHIGKLSLTSEYKSRYMEKCSSLLSQEQKQQQPNKHHTNTHSLSGQQRKEKHCVYAVERGEMYECISHICCVTADLEAWGASHISPPHLWWVDSISRRPGRVNTCLQAIANVSLCVAAPFNRWLLLCNSAIRIKERNNFTKVIACLDLWQIKILEWNVQFLLSPALNWNTINTNIINWKFSGRYLIGQHTRTQPLLPYVFSEKWRPLKKETLRFSPQLPSALWLMLSCLLLS